MPRISPALSLILISATALFGQAQPSCNANVPLSTVVHAEGLAEPVGDLTFSCTGGTAGATVSLNVFITVNTSITNRVDATGVPQGIAVTGAPVGQIRLSGTNTLNLSSLNYTVPSTPATPVAIAVSGIRVSVAPIATGTAPSVINYTIVGIGATFSGTTLQAALTFQTLLSSYLNNGVPCNGSPLPTTVDFPSFIAAGTNSSTLRITEASNAAFTVKNAGADTGLRFIVNITGYGAGARVFVPDAIAGNDASVPTSSGGYASTISAGMYTPNLNQLLLARVTGADATGAGGSLVFSQPPAGATTFSAVSEISLTNGAGYAVYEVLDSNPALRESAQIPVFVAVNSVNCPSTLNPTLSAQLAPVSSVATATQTDPIPRFVPVSPATDCTVIGDCTAPYFPTLTVDTTPLTITGSSKGGPQNAFIRVGNSGSGIVTFSTSVTYPSGAPAGWLAVTPATGSNNVTLSVVADPSNLDPGTYTATINVNAGPYGSATVPVTFTVGPVGVTVQAVGNAASFVYGAVTPGSYAVIYGLNMAGTAVAVTFNGLNAQIVYKSATQINVIVPAALANQQGAAVIVTADGKPSNSFRVNLVSNAIGLFNPGIVNVDDGLVNTQASPAARGSFISIYLTGLTLPVVPGQVTVNIGSQTGIVADFAGAQPTLPALDQVNVRVPSTLTLPPNPVKVAVCIPNTLGQQICSNQVDLYLK